MVAFNYLVPALFFNATVRQVQNLGTLSTGGTQLFAQIISATLQSEPGYSPSFTATFVGGDFLTDDPSDGVARPNVLGIVYPDDGDTPFLMQAGGVQIADAAVTQIVSTSNSTGPAIPYGEIYSVWTPTFRGGSARYADLQNSVFVGSETVSSGSKPGEFLVGIKISKVFPTKTNITVGHEFP